ncbi:N-acetylmuramoyl-L-alanine amidase [Candidatus Oleimmundimicrobium sp.]|uniref:N-acetylmuramoyl-L-alanine amidase n=1 Tax=Candidatus Oleimmundimicrobium sp. TaxID=3060597 RepID=UPI00271F2721|nr:N-acetylmuramoyl-L-alanine amidase [Candidatus Oleimmundimicrobium sp.]MDO8885645.1 N-acetylmuramoyl-L-alanine amidase [Candidatus Oleimmundimicrobium sp.]
MKLFRKGSKGKGVKDIQAKLALLGYNFGPTGVDGAFGDCTDMVVKQFQQDRGLIVDGIVGEDTWRELVEATYRLGERLLYLKIPYLRGDDVKQLQKWLNRLGFSTGAVDGIYGFSTEKALMEFQKNVGISPDGILGSSTLDAFHNLRKILHADFKVAFPWEEKIEPVSSISVFKDLVVVVDFGHGYPPDPGAIGPSGLKESEICEDLGLRFGNLLELLGAKVVYTRQQGHYLNLSKRAALANKIEANIFLSFHLNGSSNSKAEGTSTYYFAAGDQFSKEGKNLAYAIHEELLSSLERSDDRVHGRNFAVLRETKMPAALMEPVFITNIEEEKLLKDENFRQKIAIAVFDGVKKFLGIRS